MGLVTPQKPPWLAWKSPCHSAAGSTGTTFIKTITHKVQYLLLIYVILNLSGECLAEKNKNYHVASLCKNHFLQQLYRKIDGAVLRSQNERNLDCVITFQTESILQRFMLRFDQLQLDCNDHLFIYDGAHAIGNYKADLSCRHTRQSVGTIYTRTNFVTLKYVTDGWGTDTNGFHLIITAFKDKTELVCRDFRCVQKEFCISNDLLCDGINHCGDNSDETTAAICTEQSSDKIFGLGIAVFGAIIASVGVVLCALTIGIIVCCCRKRTLPPSSHPTAMANNYAAANGRGDDKSPFSPTGPEFTHSNTYSPMTPTVTTLPLKVTASENRDPPAVGSVTIRPGSRYSRAGETVTNPKEECQTPRPQGAITFSPSVRRHQA